MKKPIYSKAADCKPATLKPFISIFKSFAKSVSYLALHFSKLETTFFKKHLLYNGYTTSLQCHKTSIRQKRHRIDSYNETVHPLVNVILILI